MASEDHGKNAYARAGVDVSIEARASRIMYEAAKRTWNNRRGRIGEIVTPFDDFSGLRLVDIGNLPSGSCMSLGLDGAGTKVLLPQRVKRYGTIAHDLFAMLCDDVSVRGGEPALIGSVLDLKSLGSNDRYLPVIRELADGYSSAAEAAGVAIINGEIAQMGACISGYGDFPFNWSGACVWFGKKERLITGKDIRPGDAIVMLRESSFRCNGYSLIRQVFEEAHGPEWHEFPFQDSTLGEQALRPSTIYCRLINRLHGGFSGKPMCRISGVANITGGGIPEKLGRLLRPTGRGAVLGFLFSPPAAMLECQRLGAVSDMDAYRALGMGQGMAVITSEPEIVCDEAKEMGFEARRAGTITHDRGIRIRSRGVVRKPDTLDF